jgi:alanine racemase
MAVIKANAYGHGAVETAKALSRHGVTRVAVVSVDEGIALRQAGITASILVLGPLFREQIQDLLAHQLTPVVSEPTVLLHLAKAATALSDPYPVHLKVETGMGRLGLTQAELVTLMTSGGFPPSLRFEGLMTHLADADGDATNVTEQQLVRFSQAIDTVKACGVPIPFVHAANSGGAVRFPQAQFSLVRPGIMLYGYHTLPTSVTVPALEPVMQLRTCVGQIRTLQPGHALSYNGTFTARRPTRIAILPIGYADGLNRRLSNRGQVLIHGHRAGIIGLVCMDMVMVDITDIPGVIVGDEVIVIGRQGQDQITAADMAIWAETIPYEVLCSIGPRVPRLYCSS